MARSRSQTKKTKPASRQRKAEDGKLSLVDRRRAASGGENWTPATGANRQTDAAAQEN
jgi:hypothetical protein